MSAARDFASKTVIVISSGFTASFRTLLGPHKPQHFCSLTGSQKQRYSSSGFTASYGRCKGKKKRGSRDGSRALAVMAYCNCKV